MKWFKHDSNANTDAKLRKLRIKYGMEGYGLYWYCLELIAQIVDKNNLTFELEHDAEIISHDTGIHVERVQEMMTSMVNLGLFENNNGAVTCLKSCLYATTSNRPPPHEWCVIRNRIFSRDNYTCAYCGQRGGRLECDHIIPVSRGGLHDDVNLTTSCFTCNRKKRTKTTEEFMQ